MLEGLIARWLRWRGRRLDFRIDADYEEPHGGFRPVKVTYTWEEDGRPMRDVHVASKPDESYRILCTARPVMKSITLELAGGNG